MSSAPSSDDAARARRSRLWRWILLGYLLGIVVDFAWHIETDLTTGDREVETYEWLYGLQASLFWPLDLAAQGILALR